MDRVHSAVNGSIPSGDAGKGAGHAPGITALQLATLREIEGGKVTVDNHEYGAWRISGARRSVVGRLGSLGLTKITMFVAGAVEITDAGRAAIAKATGEQR